MNAKKTALIIVKFAISFAILYWLYYQAKKSGQIDSFLAAEKQWSWLIAALACIFATFLVSFTRWYLLVRALSLPLKWSEAVRFGFIGQLLNLVAFGVVGGDTLKAVLVYRQVKSRAAEALASIAADRAMGLLAMVSVASVAYLVFDFSNVKEHHPVQWGHIQTICQVALGATIVGVVGLVTMFVAPNIKNFAWYQSVARIGILKKISDKILGIAEAYRSRWTSLVAAFGLSLVINLLFAATIYFVACGVAQSFPTFSQHFVVAPISMVANAVPLPGGMGGMEFALTMLYDAMTPAASAEQSGFIVAIVFRLMLLSVASTGLPVYFFSRNRIKEIDKGTGKDAFDQL